jgi:hypothetical protein
MPSPRLSSLERAYFVRKLGGSVPPSRPLNQVRRDYMVAFIGGASKNIKIDNLETLWLQEVVRDAGLTPAPDTASMWKQLVSELGFSPSRHMNDNKITFFLHAP